MLQVVIHVISSYINILTNSKLEMTASIPQVATLLSKVVRRSREGQVLSENLPKKIKMMIYKFQGLSLSVAHCKTKVNLRSFSKESNKHSE